MKQEAQDAYVPALAFAPLTRFYDSVVGITTRERLFKSALVKQIELKPGQTVLDVACGTGTLALLMKKEMREAKITGIDGDPAILSIARRKTAKAGLDVSYVEGVSYKLPFDNGTYDIATSSLFFHHLSDDRKVDTAREIHRVLRPGGYFHFADWGVPTTPLMRMAFYGVQMLDGFTNTAANVEGRLLGMIAQAEFVDVQHRRSISTMFGSMSLYSARK